MPTKKRERMISEQRNHVPELCDLDHGRFANRSRVGGRTNRLEGDCALPFKNPSEIRPNADRGGEAMVCKGAKLQAESR